MYTARLQYAPDGSGGAQLPPSLGDLDTPPQDTGTQPGDSTGKPADLSTAMAQQKQEPVTPVTPAVQEGLNEDGTLKEGYEKNEKGEVVKTEPAKGEDDKGAGVDTEENFFQEVDKLRGETIEVEYPEGMDPLSPEGVYHREKAIEQRAIAGFEGYLRKSDPRGYAYLLHRQAGGSDEDFFQKKTFSLPDYEEFKANSDLQLRVYRGDLAAKGLDPASIEFLVDKAVKDKKLSELSDAAYRQVETTQKRELAEIERMNQEANEAYKRSVDQLNLQLTTEVQDNKRLNIKIPDTDKRDFMQYLLKGIEYDENTRHFLFVQPIDNESMPRQLESLYLMFKKGNLKSLIVKEAQEQNIRRLQKAVSRSQQQSVAGSTEPRKDGKFIPLGSL